ncbi:MAG TPA: hypothetical protein VK996_17400 [Ramlibacter sp.]|nr:hypothetical protein [Ramlibacter sp.]
MHGAPSVIYPVGRSRFAGLLLLVAWLLGAATALASWLQGQPFVWRIALVASLLAAAGAFAAAGWWRSSRGTLAWDGDTWNWSGLPGSPGGEIDVALDLQRWLLLRFSGTGAKHWFWLERARDEQRWDDLRRAVYSRARPQALPGAQPPAAKP